MADSSSDDGCDSDIADFVESFQVDSDDGELPLPSEQQPQPSEPQPQPQPEPELQPDRPVEDKTSMRSGCTLDDDRQLASPIAASPALARARPWHECWHPTAQ